MKKTVPEKLRPSPHLDSHDGTLDDLRQFHAQHQAWLAAGSFDQPESLSRYNQWPADWGPLPICAALT
jgi:hypothetical protein